MSTHHKLRYKLIVERGSWEAGHTDGEWCYAHDVAVLDTTRIPDTPGGTTYVNINTHSQHAPERTACTGALHTWLIAVAAHLGNIASGPVQRLAASVFAAASQLIQGPMRFRGESHTKNATQGSNSPQNGDPLAGAVRPHDPRWN